MKNQRGAITVEACVTVTLFMLLMFILLGFFMMFMAQNAVAHAALETAESLAMDAWQISKLRTGGSNAKSLGDMLSDFIAGRFDGNDPSFVSETEWWKDSSQLNEVVTARFLGYFSGGDEETARRYIKAVNIDTGSGSGLSGAFDFSESKIINGDLYVVVKYKLNYMFKIWGLEDGVDIKQTAVAHLWMEKSDSINLG